ncbi:M56 family metallopeptidase [Clostridium sp. JNZ X4-2]
MDLYSVFRMTLLSSAMGSIIAVLIFIVKRMLKTRLNAAWQYYIWFLLIIRLIVPVGFETPFSRFSVIAPVTQKIEMNKNFSESKFNKSVKGIKNQDDFAKIKLEQKNNLQKIKISNFNYYFNMASIIWAMVAAFSAVIILSINGIFIFKVNKQFFCKDTNTIRIFEECKSIMNISRSIPIVYDTHINAPSLLGIIRPKILINPDLMDRISPEEKRYIFLHELSHFRKKDIFISWIILFCGIVNWFNPIILSALHRMKEDSEIACDAHVLSYLDKNEYKCYGETIIDLIKIVSNVKTIPGSIGIINGKSNIKRRIIMIKNFKKRPGKWGAVLIFILAAVCIMGMTNLPGKTVISANEKNASEIEENSMDYVNIVKKFLPQNSQIVTLDKTKEKDSILLKNLDNDGKNEIITAYKSTKETSNEDEKINVLVLKKIGENWTKVLEEPGEGFSLDVVLTADLKGNGEKEVLLGRRIGGTAAQLSIYEWNNNVLNKISKEDIYYSKLDVINVQGKNRQDIAIWQHDTGDAYIVDILKWNGNTFIQDEDNYKEYFKEVIVPYYEQKVKAMPDAGFYWYYLADSQIKAGNKSEALKSIDRGLSLNTAYPPKENFNKLKEKALK